MHVPVVVLEGIGTAGSFRVADDQLVDVQAHVVGRRGASAVEHVEEELPDVDARLGVPPELHPASRHGRRPVEPTLQHPVRLAQRVEPHMTLDAIPAAVLDDARIPVDVLPAVAGLIEVIHVVPHQVGIGPGIEGAGRLEQHAGRPAG